MDANIGSSRRTRWTGAGIRIVALGLVLLGVGSLAGDAPALGRDRPLRVPVLMYHRITAPPPDAGLPQLWVSPRLFRAQLRLLAQHGWQAITAEELARAVLAGRTVGPRRFVITFDDGARDGFRNAAPILERLGMRATYCVVPGRTGRDWQLTASQMRRLHARGHEIANHSFTHASLPSLGAHALRRQIAWAADRIRRYVGDRPVTLCYPFGHHDRRVERVVARTGHLAAYTTVAGAAGARRERFRWPRVRVSASTSPRQLLARLEPYAHGGGREPHRPVVAASSGIILSATLPLPASDPAAPPRGPSRTSRSASLRS
jgi:peptidoglycan/xylan/chitin deacetylase (PgdA/CDA1 family)